MEPTILNQRYRLVALVGAGGMATVYRGQDLLLERTVAVKFLREPYNSDTAFRERFMAEARASARLDHPNIVRIYDVGEDEKRQPFIVMEMVEGEDLKSLIRRNGPIPVPHALNLTRQICAGVGHAHRAGIIHCDLKPQNILVTTAGQIKVADFGIARAMRGDEVSEEREEVVWGSPHYISPEQALGRPPVAASDVYSIGIIFYELLTGVPPFHDADASKLALKHVQDEPTPVTALNPRVPPGLEWLVRKVLAKDPTNRFRNADQLGMALDEYIRQGDNMTLPQIPVGQSTAHLGGQNPAQSATYAASQQNTAHPAAQNTSHAPAQSARRPHTTAPVPTAEKPTQPNLEPHTQPIPIIGKADGLLWGLLIAATVLVLGLIPLWTIVYKTYSPAQPTPRTVAPTLTPTPNTEGQMVSVPNMLGLNAPDAQRLAEEAGLIVTILGEKESTDARPGSVLEQTPGAGNRVSRNTTISVTLASGRMFVMPEVVGYDIEAIQSGLESEGLLVIREEVWSTETEGTILKQIPDPGAEVRAGNTLTLTISGGVNLPIPLQVNLSDLITLEEARVSQLNYHPGDSVAVTLRWRSVQAVNSSYKVFVHLLTQDMQTLIAQQDIEPVNTMRPTNTWMPGEVINDPHQVYLPSNTAPGTYQIRVGLYDGNGRLAVTDPGKTNAVADTIFITNIEVKP